MILFNTMTLHDIPGIAKIHANLSEGDKRHYHPCRMNLWSIFAFLVSLYTESRFNKYVTTIIATNPPYDIVMGFLFLRHRDNKCELGVIVSPYCRNTGIGKMLIYNTIKYAKAVGIDAIRLRVLKDNYSAVKLYLDSSFRVVMTVYNTYKYETRKYYEMELRVNEVQNM